MLIDVTCAYPQAGVRLHGGNADQDASAASTSGARKRDHHARLGYVSFEERNHKLVTLAVESFEHVGREGSELIDHQLAMSVVGRRDGGVTAKKGIYKKRLLQVVSVTFQVAISRRVRRYKVAFRDRQDMRGKREGEGGLMAMA